MLPHCLGERNYKWLLKIIVAQVSLNAGYTLMTALRTEIASTSPSPQPRLKETSQALY